MCPSDYLRGIQETKSIKIGLLHEADLRKTSMLTSRAIALYDCQPPYPEYFEMPLHLLPPIGEPYLHMVDTQYPGIPIGVARV
jgi:hypothetical protein